MKKSYMLEKIIRFLMFPLISIAMLNAEASLSKGDLAVIGMNGGADAGAGSVRSFAVVALNTIAEGEVIFFTDRGWVNTYTGANGVVNGHFLTASTSSFTNEGIFKWTVSAKITAGTLIIFKLDPTVSGVRAKKGDGSTIPNADLAIVADTWTNTNNSANPWPPTTGDQLIIYQVSEASPSFVFAFNNISLTNTNNSNGWHNNTGAEPPTQYPVYSELPTALGAAYSVGFFTQPSALRYPNVIYNPTLESGNKTNWLASITNVSNWATQTTANAVTYVFEDGFGSGSPKLTEFSVVSANAPAVSNVAHTGTLKEGQTLTGNYTFSDADGDTESGSMFKWYRSDNVNGNPKVEINSATGKTYLLSVNDINKYIGFEVTPRDGGLNGTAVQSPFRGPVTSSVLPVGFLGLVAKLSGKGVLLSWQTANEQHNKGFKVYRHAEGTTPALIGWVEGKGNTAASSNYIFTDSKPLNGDNYYSLVQVDLDGKENELDTKVVAFLLSGTAIVTYPNPVTDRVDISLGSGKFTEAKLLDTQGKLIKRIALAVNATSLNMDLTGLPNGVYLLGLRSGAGWKYEKLIKK
ncbi:T9SS type A sorting domain-containing protein [Pedobacter xixiisoli]|uniref:Por secretion system C-terminal sorting domain-containing protein n=1 Tax=Pedobacter xixiisoli TaxID=1476464 RepID=A0A285ZS95_9SPHI|nr:T9SS type A sorting domain-containing protein [Pedobacter xixiisoli]SOD12505.1 Por secretion system C-terminal sorting domain-containing protein [Pedobacter xixiisoli]